MSDAVMAVIAEVFMPRILVWSLNKGQENEHYVGYGSHKYSEICRLWKT